MVAETEDGENPSENALPKRTSRTSSLSRQRSKKFCELDETLTAALGLPIATRLRELTFLQSSKEEVQELCRIIEGPTEETAFIHRLRDLVSTEALHWCDMEKATLAGMLTDLLHQNGEEGAEDELAVDADQLYAVLHTEELAQMANLRNPELLRKCQKLEAEEKRQEALRNLKVCREEFADVIDRTAARNDAFMTMPVSMIFILLLMLLVESHMAIHTRLKMEESLEDWINGREDKSMAEFNIDNMETFWEWVLGVAIPGTLGLPKSVNNMTQYMLASRHVLIGDVRMSYEMFNGTTAVEWLLHTDTAASYLKDKPGEYEKATLEVGRHLSEKMGWADRWIKRIDFSFMTYNEFAMAYAVTELFVIVDKYGQAVPIMNSDAVFVNAYSDGTMYLWDVLFFILVSYTTVKESISLCATMRLGFEEFKDYWDIWNIVDWIAIAMSWMVMGLWVGLSVIMSDETLQFILSDDQKIKMDIMTLDKPKLEEIYDTVNLLRLFYLVTHVALAINTAMLVAKFFKSFQSNARLKVVTDTFIHAGPELAHFFVIFSTLFLPFVLSGHILFGNDISAMSSLFAAINTGTYTLLGDYEWYLEHPCEHFGKRLPSGMPVLLLFLWFFLFHFVITLVVMNMLMGIILEHYAAITSGLQHVPDAPPIWVQVRRYLQFKRETRGFVKLESVNRGLQNDEDPSHPEENVTEESLQRAWADYSMTEKQAQWLMDFLRREVMLVKEAVTTEEEVCASQEILLSAQDSTMSCFELSSALDEPNEELDAKLDEMVDVVTSMKKECQEFKAKLAEFAAAKAALKVSPAREFYHAATVPARSVAARSRATPQKAKKRTDSGIQSQDTRQIRKRSPPEERTKKSQRSW